VFAQLRPLLVSPGSIRRDQIPSTCQLWENINPDPARRLSGLDFSEILAEAVRRLAISCETIMFRVFYQHVGFFARNLPKFHAWFWDTASVDRARKTLVGLAPARLVVTMHIRLTVRITN